MGSLILTVGRRTSHPYRIRLIGRNVFSPEELCYSLEQCAVFLDDSIVDPALAQWLEEECGLSELAHQLRLLQNGRGTVEEYVIRILSHIAYQTPQRIQQIRSQMTGGRGMEPFLRRRKEALLAASRGQSSRAKEMLDRLLADLPPLESMLRSQIWADKGRLAAEEFDFSPAADYYKKAWELAGRRDCCVLHLAALRFSLSPGDYEAYLQDHPALESVASELDRRTAEADRAFGSGAAGRSIKRLERYLKDKKTGSFDSYAQQQLRQMQDEYRAGQAPAF